MSNKLPYMPFFVADYLADTTHLTCEEHGAYMLLLMVMWKAGGSLPCEDIALARITRLPLPRWKKVAPNVLPFFVVEGAVLRHRRVSAEIEKSQKISQARSEIGKRGGEAKALKEKEAVLANAENLPKQKPGKTLPSHTSSINTTSNSIALDAAREAAPPSEDQGLSAAKCVELGQRITDLMGVTNDPRWLGNWSQVQVWLARGYDPELDIWPAVSARIDRVKKTNGRMPTSLKYFDQIIADHHAARTASTAPTTSQQTGSRPSVWVWKGTPQWEAWSKGRPRPWPTKDQRHPDGSMRPGWFFPSEWPPNAPASPQEAA